MKEAGKSSVVVEEICSTEDLDKDTYEEAREKAANILLEEKAESREKKGPSFGNNKKRKHN
jgi:hypothetical protein